MDRRSFLKLLGITAAVVAVPKIVAPEVGGVPEIVGDLDIAPGLDWTVVGSVESFPSFRGGLAELDFTYAGFLSGSADRLGALVRVTLNGGGRRYFEINQIEVNSRFGGDTTRVRAYEVTFVEDREVTRESPLTIDVTGDDDGILPISVLDEETKSVKPITDMNVSFSEPTRYAIVGSRYPSSLSPRYGSDLEYIDD